MRNIFVALLLALFCLNLSGCAPVRTQAEIDQLDYGPYPENYQEIVKNYLVSKLADPYSAHYQFSGQPEHYYEQLYMGIYYAGEVWGWAGIVNVNAKNLYGAYVGFRPYRYVIRYGNVVFMY